MHAIMERILFLWAVRHPACSYVQGINDLVTPFLAVFLAEKQNMRKFQNGAARPNVAGEQRGNGLGGSASASYAVTK